MNANHGLFVIDKPIGITSRDALDQAAKWFPRKTRLGHAGTLDPLATGVLVVCVGQATRLIEYVQDMPKVYVAEVFLGARSATDDAEGPITTAEVERQPDHVAIETALTHFVGEIQQTPPAFSAVKIEGQRAYDRARRGSSVELSPRPVRIDRIDIKAFEFPRLILQVRCGKGTYIRSLARDLGEELGCGAYLSGLRRIAIGRFTVENAWTLDSDPAAARSHLLPLSAAVVQLPRVVVSQECVALLRHGHSVPSIDCRNADEVAVFDATDSLIAIATVEDGSLRPNKVFAA